MSTESESGRRLRLVREGAGLTQRQLAAKLDVTQAAVAHWETGRHKPRPTWHRKIAEALEVPRSVLFPEDAA